jgi:hypothetical protein
LTAVKRCGDGRWRWARVEKRRFAIIVGSLNFALGALPCCKIHTLLVVLRHELLRLVRIREVELGHEPQHT